MFVQLNVTCSTFAAFGFGLCANFSAFIAILLHKFDDFVLYFRIVFLSAHVEKLLGIFGYMAFNEKVFNHVVRLQRMCIRNWNDSCVDSFIFMWEVIAFIDFRKPEKFSEHGPAMLR